MVLSASNAKHVHIQNAHLENKKISNHQTKGIKLKDNG